MILTNKQKTYYPILSKSPSVPLSLSIISGGLDHFLSTIWVNGFHFKIHRLQAVVALVMLLIFVALFPKIILVTIGIKKDTKTSLSLNLSRRIHIYVNGIFTSIYQENQPFM